MNSLILIFVILFYACPFSRDFARHEIIIWNVGQGQWVSWVTPEKCIHLDMGGEHPPPPLLKLLCHEKFNAVNFSHWDLDHMNFILKGKGMFPLLCRYDNHQDQPQNSKKRHWLKKIKTCPSVLEEGLQFETFKTSRAVKNWSIFAKIENRILIPGDAPQEEEHLWTFKHPSSPINTLILGHHGSRTSSSREFLEKLPYLRQAIASARQERYGHPHQEVVNRLTSLGVALLKTQDWGHIHIFLQ